ncbi:MAG: hypothetical protein Q4D12_10445, partial [Bacteroidales bacterium]|nr:hypothetical protein [Bacteroidales bacterium]
TRFSLHFVMRANKFDYFANAQNDMLFNSSFGSSQNVGHSIVILNEVKDLVQQKEEMTCYLNNETNY